MISNNVATLLSEFYPEITQKPDISTFVRQNRINVINLVTGIGSPEINRKMPKISRKLLIVINDILITKSDFETMVDKLKINEFFIDQLNRGVLVPSRDFIERLIKTYKVNPTFLYDNSKKLYV
jgi:hypothetical protein